MWGFAASPPKRNNAAERAAAKAQLNVYRSPAGPRKTAKANGVKAVGGRKTRRSVRRTRRSRA